MREQNHTRLQKKKNYKFHIEHFIHFIFNPSFKVTSKVREIVYTDSATWMIRTSPCPSSNWKHCSDHSDTLCDRVDPAYKRRMPQQSSRHRSWQVSTPLNPFIPLFNQVFILHWDIASPNHFAYPHNHPIRHLVFMAPSIPILHKSLPAPQSPFWHILQDGWVDDSRSAVSFIPLHSSSPGHCPKLFWHWVNTAQDHTSIFSPSFPECTFSVLFSVIHSQPAYTVSFQDMSHLKNDHSAHLVGSTHTPCEVSSVPKHEKGPSRQQSFTWHISVPFSAHPLTWSTEWNLTAWQSVHIVTDPVDLVSCNQFTSTTHIFVIKVTPMSAHEITWPTMWHSLQLSVQSSSHHCESSGSLPLLVIHPANCTIRFINDIPSFLHIGEPFTNPGSPSLTVHKVQMSEAINEHLDCLINGQAGC